MPGFYFYVLREILKELRLVNCRDGNYVKYKTKKL